MIYAYIFYFLSFFASIINPFWGLVGLIISIFIRFQDRFPGIVAIKPFSLLFLGMIIGGLIIVLVIIFIVKEYRLGKQIKQT